MPGSKKASRAAKTGSFKFTFGRDISGLLVGAAGAAITGLTLTGANTHWAIARGRVIIDLSGAIAYPSVRSGGWAGEFHSTHILENPRQLGKSRLREATRVAQDRRARFTSFYGEYAHRPPHRARRLPGRRPGL